MAKQVFVSQILPSPASQPMGQKLVLWHAELKIINLLWMLPFDKSFLVNRNGNQIFHFHIMIALAMIITSSERKTHHSCTNYSLCWPSGKAPEVIWKHVKSKKAVPAKFTTQLPRSANEVFGGLLKSAQKVPSFFLCLLSFFHLRKLAERGDWGDWWQWS